MQSFRDCHIPGVPHKCLTHLPSCKQQISAEHLTHNGLDSDTNDVCYCLWCVGKHCTVSKYTSVAKRFQKILSCYSLGKHCALHHCSRLKCISHESRWLVRANWEDSSKYGLTSNLLEQLEDWVLGHKGKTFSFHSNTRKLCNVYFIKKDDTDEQLNLKSQTFHLQYFHSLFLNVIYTTSNSPYALSTWTSS